MSSISRTSSISKKKATRNFLIILAVCLFIGFFLVILMSLLRAAHRNRQVPSPSPSVPSPSPSVPSPSPSVPSPAAPNPSAPPSAPSPAPVPSVPSVPPAPSLVGWNSVRSLQNGESKNAWSSRIYNAITGGASAGEDPNTGGKNYNVQHCGLNQISVMTKPMADCFCKNPCYYYGTKYGQGAKLAAAGMCDCTREVAINF